MTNASVLFLAAGVLATGVAGCHWSSSGERFAPHIAAVVAPESVSAGDRVSVQVFTSRYNCADRVDDAIFHAVDDSTLELSVRQVSGPSGLGCPGGVYPTEFVLPHAPARRFVLRIVGADTMRVAIAVAPVSTASARFTFRVEPGNYGATFDSFAVELRGCYADTTIVPHCETFAPVGFLAGHAGVLTQACRGNLSYSARVTAFSRTPPAYANDALEFSGTLACGTPMQMTLRW